MPPLTGLISQCIYEHYVSELPLSQAKMSDYYSRGVAQGPAALLRKLFPELGH